MLMEGYRITDRKFFTAPADTLAVALLGKILVVRGLRARIAETECYMGVSDSACHAARKNPVAARVLWERGGTLYVRMIYGMYYMLNIVAGEKDDPMGVLIRGSDEIVGPGRLTRALGIGADFNGEDLLASNRIWLEDDGAAPSFTTAPRVGIGYAKKVDRDAHRRFLAYNGN